MRVLLTAEQLRRPVPGGIGTYVRGLVQGLDAPAGVELGLWASRESGAGPDPLTDLGPTVVTSWLPTPMLTRAWDRGLTGPPSKWGVVHATSLATPPVGRRPMTVMVHDVAWRAFPEAYPRRGRRWHEAALGRARERARLLLVPSQQTANDLMACGVSSSRMPFIPR